jgi:CheY-like chemotaxis protein
MVYGFVKQSGGHIEVRTELSHGTTVMLYLPRAANSAGSIPKCESDQVLDSIEATILLVEDDAMVRNLTHDQLVALGYQVIMAVNGHAALEIVRQRADLDLLFTDIEMPGGMNGVQLAAAAIALRPSLKVLYASGYTEHANNQNSRLLSKPYRRAELAKQVREVLMERA